MRRLARFRWLLPALLVPAAVATLGVGAQIAVLRRPPRDSLVAAGAVAELLRYHVMRGTEDVGGHEVPSVCVQGWFHGGRHHRLVRGALVLLGDDERLYDVGEGVRRLGREGPVDPADRLRFLLAGCPRFIGDRIVARLLRGAPIDADPVRLDGRSTLLITFGRRSAPIALYVDRLDYRPVELAIASTPGYRTDLQPGGGRPVISRVRADFGLSHRPRPRHA